MQEEIVNKKEKSERERQTFFRVAFKNNCNLLQIADNKANMIISINALVISSIIAITGYGTVSDNLDLYGSKMIIPIIFIMISCFASTVLGVQAAKPKIISDKKNVANQNKGSLLFFGESSSYSVEGYLMEIDKILPSKDEINNQMAIILYYQGKVLKNKYNLLGYAYNVFIMGLAIGVLAFLIYLGFDYFWSS
jgi:hypothetical protein